MTGSASDLINLKNEEFVTRIQEIINEADNHKKELITEYGLTNSFLESIKANLDYFLELQGKPAAYRVMYSQATKSLESLFTDANNLLSGKLDKLIKIFKRTDPNFYNGYMAARVVVNK